MKKLLLIFTIILSNICLSQSNGTSYSKGNAKPFETWNDTYSIRWNMNNIAQTLNIDSTKITFYYYNNNDWGFMSYIGYINGQIFEKSGYNDNDVTRYENLSEFYYYNTMYEDSSTRGYNFMPKHVAMDSIASMKNIINSKDGSVTNELQVLSGSGTNTLVLSIGGGTFVIPTQTTALTSTAITSALTYTPYNGTNPSGYISSFTESDPIWNTDKTNYGTKTFNDGRFLQTEVDGSVTNEIQTISRSSNTVTLSNGGGSFTLTPSTDSQTLSISSNSLSISGGNNVILPVIGIVSGNGITINSSLGTYTISTSTRTMSTATRSLNTSYTISATSDYNVNYSVYAQVTSALAGTNTADVYLEISPNNSTWTTISRSGISVAGVLSTSGNTQTVGGFIPAGYYVRLRTAATGANSGVAVFTYQNGQENSY